MVLPHENFTTLFTGEETACMFPYVGLKMVLAHENFTTLFTRGETAGMFLYVGALDGTCSRKLNHTFHR